MGLKIYRRHRLECEAGHPENARSGDWEESRRGWKRCNCVIHISGTLGGRFSRRSTGKTTWDEARAYVSVLEVAGSWDGKVTPRLPESVPAAGPPRITIEEACNVFLATREAAVGYPTHRKYKTFTKQLQAFADSRGYVMLDQFRAGDIDVFYTKSKLGPRSKAKMIERLRHFFRFAVNREWLPKSPVSPDLKAPAGAHRLVNKAPFTDEPTKITSVMRSHEDAAHFHVLHQIHARPSRSPSRARPNGAPSGSPSSNARLPSCSGRQCECTPHLHPHTGSELDHGRRPRWRMGVSAVIDWQQNQASGTG